MRNYLTERKAEEKLTSILADLKALLTRIESKQIGSEPESEMLRRTR